MGACPTLSYTGVSASAWSAIQARVETETGVAISATNSGSDSADGFTLEWSYDPGASSLTVTCTVSPWYVPCSTINGEIDGLIRPLIGLP